MAAVIATLRVKIDGFQDWGEGALQNSRCHVLLETEDKTPPGEDRENEETPSQRSFVSRRTPPRSIAQSTQHGAIIRLADILRSPTGVTFGQAKDCDFVFVSDTRLSQRHCSITISEENRIIVRDWGSRNGTEVVYDNKVCGARVNCDWILNDITNHENVELHLQLAGKVSFIITMNPFNPTFDECASINTWRSDNNSALDRVQDLSFPSGPSTTLPSKFATPVSRDRILEKVLGQGSFGRAIHQFNTRTGEQFVKKIPRENKPFRLEDWRREAQVLRQISHDHIIKLINFIEPASPSSMPEIHLEYMPRGTLNDHCDLSLRQKKCVLMQCLSAIRHLDDHKLFIAHRDIKPDNIFVHSRSRTNICVKLGDFGFAKTTKNANTVCGSPGYFAPEILLYSHGDDREPSSYNNTRVDVWSLGVVVAELVHEFSTSHTDDPIKGIRWTKNLLHELREGLPDEDKYRPVWTGEEKMKKFLLDYMLVFDENKRWSAEECHAAAMSNYGLLTSGCCDMNLARYELEPSDDGSFSTNTTTPTESNAFRDPTITPTEGSVTPRGPSMSSQAHTVIWNPIGQSETGASSRRRTLRSSRRDTLPSALGSQQSGRSARPDQSGEEVPEEVAHQPTSTVDVWSSDEPPSAGPIGESAAPWEGVQSEQGFGQGFEA